MDRYNACVGKPDSALAQACDLECRHPAATPITKSHVYYFDGASPQYYFDDNAMTWYAGFKPEPGWYAISAQYYQDSLHKPFESKQRTHHWLDKYPMLSRAGDSIFIFYVPDNAILPASPDAH